MRGKLAGFRGVHSGRYRIIWRITPLESGEKAAEVCYVGIRSEGDESDAYAEAERLFGSMGWL